MLCLYQQLSCANAHTSGKEIAQVVQSFVERKFAKEGAATDWFAHVESQGVGLTCPKAQGAESISARMMMQYAADPSSSAASCKQVQKDLVTAVHNEQHM